MKHYANVHYPSKSYCKSSSKDITTSSKNVTCPKCLELLAKQARNSEYELGDYDIKDDMIGVARRTITKPQNERVSIGLLKALIREALERSEIDSFIQKMEENGWIFKSTARQLDSNVYVFEATGKQYALAKIEYDGGNQVSYVGYKIAKTSMFNSLKASNLDAAFKVINDRLAHSTLSKALKNDFDEGTSWILKDETSFVQANSFLIYEDEDLKNVLDIMDVDSFLIIMGQPQKNGAVRVEFNGLPACVDIQDLKHSRLKASMGPRRLTGRNESNTSYLIWILLEDNTAYVTRSMADDIVEKLNNELKNDYRFYVQDAEENMDNCYLSMTPLKFHSLRERENVDKLMHQVINDVLQQYEVSLKRLNVNLMTYKEAVKFLTTL